MTDSAVPVAEVDDAAASKRLGGQIRMLRKTRGLTLVQLADATELSHPFLSQLERGLAQPSLGSLRRIALALQTSPIELIAAADAVDEPGRECVEISTPGEGTVPEGFASGSARMLAHRSSAFHPMEVESDRDEPGELFVHAEDEFVYVIEGRVCVEVDSDVHELEAGASVYYSGGVTHRWWSADGGPYRLLVVKQVPGRAAARVGADSA